MTSTNKTINKLDDVNDKKYFLISSKIITGDGKPLGDRELMLKKKRTSTSDLSSPGKEKAC